MTDNTISLDQDNQKKKNTSDHNKNLSIKTNEKKTSDHNKIRKIEIK